PFANPMVSSRLSFETRNSVGFGAFSCCIFDVFPLHEPHLAVGFWAVPIKCQSDPPEFIQEIVK
ncbi:MAG: hypothetical protein KDJ51_12260, partial [Nitratireductor sp.]|nr:hypothetical protein [Nitratireductor sp.]